MCLDGSRPQQLRRCYLRWCTPLIGPGAVSDSAVASDSFVARWEGQWASDQLQVLQPAVAAAEKFPMVAAAAVDRVAVAMEEGGRVMAACWVALSAVAAGCGVGCLSVCRTNASELRRMLSVAAVC